ncbi:MAG TPA: glycoside hydrolase family 20 zincin-like fold domain-containing protein, partial [Candidatus Acidoferrales bacterium]|nr:glycoside hydrolase family 20 zincin-like fold domain-containing protein [Candidatus Acidoferrales bacterium]
MKSYLSGICGTAILACTICAVPRVGGADANGRIRQRSAVDARATEGAAQTQSVKQTQRAAQTVNVTQTQAAGLHLLPQPREIRPSNGTAFVVTRRTRIVVSIALGGKNFEGAQMLEDEIERWTGWETRISVAREMPGGADVIYIGDATKDSRLRSALENQGLPMQKGFDEQGYAIFADAHRILVGGASAEGAFDGVQTLRQLLRPASVSSANEKADSSS